MFRVKTGNGLKGTGEQLEGVEELGGGSTQAIFAGGRMCVVLAKDFSPWRPFSTRRILSRESIDPSLVPAESSWEKRNGRFPQIKKEIIKKEFIMVKTFRVFPIFPIQYKLDSL